MKCLLDDRYQSLLGQGCPVVSGVVDQRFKWLLDVFLLILWHVLQGRVEVQYLVVASDQAGTFRFFIVFFSFRYEPYLVAVEVTWSRW